MTCEENHDETIGILEGQILVLEDRVTDLESRLEDAENERDNLTRLVQEADDDLDTVQSAVDELRKTLNR